MYSLNSCHLNRFFSLNECMCVQPFLTEVTTGSRRPSMSSLRSGSFAIVEPRGMDGDHYLVYIRGPTHSLTSDTTTTTGCDSPHSTQHSTEQLLAVYHTLPEVRNIQWIISIRYCVGS